MPAKAGIHALLFIGLAAPALARTDIITLSKAPQPPPGYTALPYANANAPKGGAFTISNTQPGSFDNLNPFILAGTAPDTMLQIWQPLFKLSDTDSVTAYAELAQGCDISADGLTITFHLNPAARFSDGTKVTSADVAWTYHILITKGLPIYARLYAGVSSVATPDAETIIFRLRPGAGRDAALNLSGIYVLPKHFWAHRDFAAPLKDIPIGSGPYVVASVSYGNFITYARVKHWWAEHLPSDQGFYNFDFFSEQFFHDDSVALQAFKAGQIDARFEPSPQLWATGYKFPAVQSGSVGLAQVPFHLPQGIQGLVMNSRRPIFASPLVRQALALAFDFQWMNKTLFYGAYTREQSYFSASPMASSGLPSQAELKLLNPWRGRIPAAVFTTPFTLPVTDGSGYNLPQLEAAMRLLTQAGWRVENFKLEDKSGRQMAFEALFDDPADLRIMLPFAADLRLLGIAVTIRLVDAVSYQNRLNDFDYDMTKLDIPQTDAPGAEQADYWGCAAATTHGSNNWAGICSPAIDAMIAAEIAAPGIAAKTTAIHALDRLLLNGWFVIPWWQSNTLHLAWWQNRVAKQPSPLQVGYDYSLWWHR